MKTNEQWAIDKPPLFSERDYLMTGKIKHAALIFVVSLGLLLPQPVTAGGPDEEEREGPLAELPSEPGEHLERIRALGDNEWLDLGSPEPDPDWGKARGRSWSPRAPFAPDIRGAFFFGEGPHGMVKPDGHYMDDLWFYDLNQHRWICVYPGIKADGGYDEVKINEDGFEATPDGNALPIASMVHAYAMVTYDTDRKLFMSKPCPGAYWRDDGDYHRGIRGRVASREENRDKLYRGPASPWIYNTVRGHWERHRTENPGSPGGFGATLIYVPSVRKAFGYKNRSSRVAWYDPDARDWQTIERRGNLPPWHIDPNSCYDSKRDRIYIGGGLYPVLEEGESALWMFDVQTETFSRLEPEGAPASTNYSTNRAMMNYDCVNDVVVLIHYRVREGETPGVYVYHPDENKWETVSERPPALAMHGNPTWTGFYDPELNAHFMHRADDGRDNGTMWVYRYKRAEE